MDTFLVTRFEDSRVVQVDTLVQELLVSRIGDSRALLQVYHQRDFSGKQFVDSLWMDSATLEPKLHRRTAATSTVDIAYNAGRITGRVGLDGEPIRQIDTLVATPVFDGAALDLVARALPLDLGSTAVLRIYVAGVGVYPLRMTAIGRDSVMTRAGVQRSALLLSGTFGGAPLSLKIASDDQTLLELIDGPPGQPNLRYQR